MLYANINFMAVVLDFHCDVISCELARHRVRRGAAKVSGSGGVQHVGAVTRFVWPRSSIEGCFYPRDAMLARYCIAMSNVPVTVCLSQVCVLSKRMDGSI